MSWWPLRFGHSGDEDHISTQMHGWNADSHQLEGAAVGVQGGAHSHPTRMHLVNTWPTSGAMWLSPLGTHQVGFVMLVGSMS